MDKEKKNEIAVKKKRPFFYANPCHLRQQFNCLAEIALLPVEMLHSSCQFLLTVSSNKINNEFYSIFKNVKCLIKIN